MKGIERLLTGEVKNKYVGFVESLYVKSVVFKVLIVYFTLLT